MVVLDVPLKDADLLLVELNLVNAADEALAVLIDRLLVELLTPLAKRIDNNTEDYVEQVTVTNMK